MLIHKKVYLLVFIFIVSSVYAQIPNRSLLYFDYNHGDSSSYYTSVFVNNSKSSVQTNDTLKSRSDWGVDEFLDAKKSYLFTHRLLIRKSIVYSCAKNSFKQNQETNLFNLDDETSYLVDNSIQIDWGIFPISIRRYTSRNTMKDSLFYISDRKINCYQIIVESLDTTKTMYSDWKSFSPYLERRTFYIEKESLIPIFVIIDHLRNNGKNDRFTIKLSEIIDCSNSKIRKIGRRK